MTRKETKKETMSANMLKFCEYYLETRNGTRSYASAYDKDIDSEEGKKKNYNSVSTNASKLLKDWRVRKYLEHRMLEMNYERDLSEQEIVMQLNKIALGGQYKENTRMDALKMLARMKGMYEGEDKSQDININLSADLQEAIEQSSKPNPQPKIED